MPAGSYPKITRFSASEDLRRRLKELDCSLPVDDVPLSSAQGSPLARPLEVGGFRLGNRWCIHPMEGWDANPDGSPSELTLRRWRHFGGSGAKWIWGGEAAAVRPDGRANPRQTLAVPANSAGLRALYEAVTGAHGERFGQTDDLWVGLQLTHSGRFCRPNSEQLEPRIAYHHPLLDERFGIDPDDDSVVWSDAELEQLVEDYCRAATLARDTGFQFVDIKACHGYLLHEFLSARERPGPFGGDYDGRTRLLKTIIGEIRRRMPDLSVVVRLSVFDSPPFEKTESLGRPVAFDHVLPYSCGFGVDAARPLAMDLSEPVRLIAELDQLGVVAVNVTCGSPYYNPHLQRPALYPPSDGYSPPEDPLCGVFRQIQAARQCKAAVPHLPMVGSGYTYLQEFLPHVAQAVVREGWIDAVGLGRMVLSYPEMPVDVLEGREPPRGRVCRTFSDCTTGPRNGLVSGCFPLDPFYKQHPDAPRLKMAKRG